MTWSKEPPTRDGYWWWRAGPDSIAEPLMIVGGIVDGGGPSSGDPAGLGGEWYGQEIAPPPHNGWPATARRSEPIQPPPSGEAKREPIVPALPFADSTRDVWMEPDDKTLCPSCGARDVYTEIGEGDYYIGPESVCGACGASFYLPRGVEVRKGYVEAIRAAQEKVAADLDALEGQARMLRENLGRKPRCAVRPCDDPVRFRLEVSEDVPGVGVIETVRFFCADHRDLVRVTWADEAQPPRDNAPKEGPNR